MTLRIMEGTGIKVPNEQALKIFDEHGARVDYETQIVKIPPSWWKRRSIKLRRG